MKANKTEHGFISTQKIIYTSLWLLFDPCLLARF